MVFSGFSYPARYCCLVYSYINALYFVYFYGRHYLMSNSVTISGKWKSFVQLTDWRALNKLFSHWGLVLVWSESASFFQGYLAASFMCSLSSVSQSSRLTILTKVSWIAHFSWLCRYLRAAYNNLLFSFDDSFSFVDFTKWFTVSFSSPESLLSPSLANCITGTNVAMHSLWNNLS